MEPLRPVAAAGAFRLECPKCRGEQTRVDALEERNAQLTAEMKELRKEDAGLRSQLVHRRRTYLERNERLRRIANEARAETHRYAQVAPEKWSGKKAMNEVARLRELLEASYRHCEGLEHLREREEQRRLLYLFDKETSTEEPPRNAKRARFWGDDPPEASGRYDTTGPPFVKRLPLPEGLASKVKALLAETREAAHNRDAVRSARQGLEQANGALRALRHGLAQQAEEGRGEKDKLRQQVRAAEARLAYLEGERAQLRAQIKAAQEQATRALAHRETEAKEEAELRDGLQWRLKLEQRSSEVLRAEVSAAKDSLAASQAEIKRTKSAVKKAERDGQKERHATTRDVDGAEEVLRVASALIGQQRLASATSQSSNNTRV